MNPDLLFQVAGAALFGMEIDRDAILALFPNFGVPEPWVEEWKHNAFLFTDVDLGHRTFAGLVADPEETDAAAEGALHDVDEETFINVRDFVREAPYWTSLLGEAYDARPIISSTP